MVGMQELRVIGVESGALLVASDDGTRFRIPIDEVLQSKLRQNPVEPGTGRKLAPREIQAHIRAGMSAQDVASVTGVPLDYIQKFEGPVLAEREFVIETALAVAVHTAMETDPMSQGTTFGSVIIERLHDLGAVDERWASWKDLATGWIVKLSFSIDEVEHDARWRFDPKKHALSPMNNEAITLSQQGDAAGPLIPRLRAVTPADREADASRFDSGAFDLGAAEPSEKAAAAASITASIDPREETVTGNQTADLLEALRRRRGEREAASFDEDDLMSTHPSMGPVRLVDVPMPTQENEPPDDGRATAPQPIAKARKGRAAMPSWDEIVFGARPDEDPA
jgi:hypothetical protein